jgi:hypothetical protein
MQSMQSGINPRKYLGNLTTIDDHPKVSHGTMESAYEMDKRIGKWFISEINYTHHIGTHARLVSYCIRQCCSERALYFKPHQTDTVLGENIT